MKQTNNKLQRTKALALVLSTLGLMLALSPSASAGAKKTYFTIVENPVGIPSMGEVLADGEQLFILGAESSYEETATDPRLTGLKVITYDAVFDPTDFTGRMWGRSRKQHPDGAWDGYWTGTRTAFTAPDSTPHLRSTITSLAVGSGAFKGLVVRWDITAVDAAPGTPMTGSGYIIEAKGGPGERPMQSRSEGTERVEVHLGMFVPPPPPPEPPVFGAVVTWEILNEVAQASHMGRSANQGGGLLNPLTGEVSGAGVLTSANGDRLYWVATGWSLGPSGPVDLSLHWAGGTGRFEAAVGAISGTLDLDATGDPSLMDLSLSAQGTIRY